MYVEVDKCYTMVLLYDPIKGQGHGRFQSCDNGRFQMADLSLANMHAIKKLTVSCDTPTQSLNYIQADF